MPKTSPRSPSPRLLAPLALILLLAGGLRFFHLGVQSLSREEGIAAQASVLPLGAMIEAAERGIDPPGYPLLLAAWQALAGRSEFGLRLLSVMAGVVTVALIYALGVHLFDRRVGVLAAALTAISPFQVDYSQIAVPTALLGMLSAASVLLTQAILTLPGEMQSGRFRMRRAVITATAYVLVNSVGLYIHSLFFLIIVLAETLIFLVWLARRSHRLHGVAVWMGLQSATLILFTPWLLLITRQHGGAEQVGGSGLPTLLIALVYGPTLPAATAQNGLLPLALLAVVGLFPPVEPTHDRHYLRFIERIGLIAIWLIASLAQLIWPATRQRLFEVLLPANLAWMVLVGRGAVLGFDLGKPLPSLDRRGSRPLHALFAVMLGLGMIPAFDGLYHFYADPAYIHDDYRSLAARITQEAGSQAEVVLAAPEQYAVFTWYYPDGPGIVPLPNSTTEATLAHLIASYRRIYAVYWNEVERDPEHIIEQTLQAQGLAASTGQYGSVRLVIYAVTGPAAAQPQTLSGAQFGDSIILDGFALSATTLAPGQGLGVTLFWHTTAPLETRYKIFVHLYGPNGALITQHDSEPANFMMPTDSWLPGEGVADFHGLLMPDAPPGTYQLVVGLYDQSGTRLPVTGGGQAVGDHLPLAEITVP